MNKNNSNLAKSPPLVNPGSKIEATKQEELLKDQQRTIKQFKSILDASPNVIVILDSKQQIVEIARSVTKFFGIEPELIRGKSFESFVERIKPCFEKPDILIEVLKKKTQNSQENEFVHTLDAGGSLKLINPSERFIGIFTIVVDRSDDEDVGNVWVFNDITSFVKKDEQLHAIVDASPIPLFISSIKDGKVIYANKNLEHLAGYKRDEIIGKLSSDFYADPSECEALAARVQKVGYANNQEVKLCKSDGTMVWIIISLVLTSLNNEEVIVGGLFDISAQKNAIQEAKATNLKLRKAQSQLIQSEKMASLGMLVAGIAHEINTPIAAISSMHDTMMRAMNKLGAFCQVDDKKHQVNPDKIQEFLNMMLESNKVIKSASARVAKIVKQLNSFARLDETELKKININDQLDDTLVILNHKLKYGITVEKKYGEVQDIACYPGHINQVLLNIINNACQAITPPGTITLETGIEGTQLYFTISDTGCGIDQKNLKTIFDPGFTTKGVGVGTGLGLSITYKIIQEHRGDIVVTSELGKGTTFKIILPLDLEQKLKEKELKK